MKQVIVSPSAVRLEIKRSASSRLWESVAWLFSLQAERWRRRAGFYRRYRNYFPRLSSGRFIERCRELETMYRGLAAVMLAMPAHDQWVPVQETVIRRKNGRRTDVSHYPALISMR